MNAKLNEAAAAVVVPLYRERITADERLSIRHLLHHLPGWPIVAVAPPGLRTPSWAREVRRFDAAYFDSVSSYSRLLLSASFYRAFADFSNILIYQLDSLVFSSDLQKWCQRGWHYIGAPWLRLPSSRRLYLVGNGGFSLRSIDAHLEVLTAGAPSALGLLEFLLAEMASEGEWSRRSRRLIRSLRVVREACRGSRWYASQYSLNEDRFWSERARLFWRGFRIAPLEEALAFSMEQAPPLAFALNGYRLPFGCHGWARYGRDFWAPHTLEG